MAEIAPTINDGIKKFMNEGMDGVQSFQSGIMELIWGAQLCERKWISTDEVGAHPDNRDNHGLLPIDVHDLLVRIVKAGWSWEECRGATVVEVQIGCADPPAGIRGEGGWLSVSKDDEGAIGSEQRGG